MIYGMSSIPTFTGIVIPPVDVYGHRLLSPDVAQPWQLPPVSRFEIMLQTVFATCLINANPTNPVSAMPGSLC